MAIRYSGGLKINVVYRDQGDYRAVITEYGPEASRRRHPLRAVVYVNPAASGFGRGVAYDSPQAYDEIAGSALSFADDRDQEQEWVGELAAFDREGNYWHVGRTPAQAWPKP